MQSIDRFFATGPKRDVGVATRGRHAHKGLGHKTRDQVVLSCDLGADLSIRSQTIRIAGDIVEHPVQFELSRGVFMVALNHVQPHGIAIVDDLHENRPQRFELVNVVAVWVRETAIWLAVGTSLQPHHLRLRTDTKIHVVLVPKLLMKLFEIAAAVRSQCHPRILSLFAVTETHAKHAGHALVPRQLTEGFRIRKTNEFL